MSNVSSIQRLRSLPAVFDLRDVEIAIGCERKTAVQYCWRWKEADLIKPLQANRSTVFFNLIVAPDAPETHRYDALEKLLRRPMVVIGASSLHAHGWSTQRPHILEVAVPVGRGLESLPKMHGIELIGRYRKWFATLYSSAEPGNEGFQFSRPEFALADSILAASRARKTAWVPDPDDVSIPDEESRDRLKAALTALGATNEELETLMERYSAENWAKVERY